MSRWELAAAFGAAAVWIAVTLAHLLWRGLDANEPMYAAAALAVADFAA